MSSFLRLPQVMSRTGLSRSTIYARIQRDEFPPPVKLGTRASGWLDTTIDEWMDRQIANSRLKSTAMT